MAAVVTMKQLLESGVHFGHQTRRWNPKMKRYIFTERNGIYIIDLQRSLTYIDRSYEFLKETVAHGGTVLFVGTKKQAQEVVEEQAKRVGMPYVNHRWLGGMLTNFSTVYRRLQRLKELEEFDFDGSSIAGMTKKERLGLQREKEKLERSLGGIRDMQRVPSAVWIVDTKKEHIATREARKLRIPVVAILDTNCDPDEVDYPIPGNDDAIRSVTLLTRIVADAVAEGLIARAGGAVSGEEKPEPTGELGAEEPLAEWERELLEGTSQTDQATATGEPAAATPETSAEPARTRTEAGESGTEPVASAQEASEPASAPTETGQAASEQTTETVADAQAEAGEPASSAEPATKDQSEESATEPADERVAEGAAPAEATPKAETTSGSSRTRRRSRGGFKETKAETEANGETSAEGKSKEEAEDGTKARRATGSRKTEGAKTDRDTEQPTES